MVIARRDPAGMVTMPAKPYLVIPAALRRRCGLRPGDHVLLAASPGEDKLAAYSFAVVDQALRAHAPLPRRRREAAMTAVHLEASRQAVVEAALVLLERMGLTPADLAAVPQPHTAVPTFAEYIPVVSAAVSAGTRRAYGSYWNRVVEHRGGRRLDEPTPSEIRQLMAYVKAHVVARRNAPGRQLPWVRTQQISTHWIRHTTLTWVERRGVASDATFRAWREDGAVRDCGPGYSGAAITTVERTRRPRRP